MNTLKQGSKVYWNSPNPNVQSGWYDVTEICTKSGTIENKNNFVRLSCGIVVPYHELYVNNIDKD